MTIKILPNNQKENCDWRVSLVLKTIIIKALFGVVLEIQMYLKHILNE